MQKSLFIASLVLMSVSPLAFSASRNLCDDLLDSGSTEEQVNSCQDKYGVSDYAKSKGKKEERAKKDAEEKASKNEALRNNLEYKEFKEVDLLAAGFGKPFLAKRLDYRTMRVDEKVLTTSDSLCFYLGYEKAVKSLLSEEMQNEDASKKALIIDTSFLGSVKDPEMYKESDDRYTVRKFVSITCVRRKDKSMEGSDDIMKLISDVQKNAEEISEAGDAPKRDGRTQVDNSKRSEKPADKPSPSSFGYKPPEWSQPTGTSK